MSHHHDVINRRFNKVAQKTFSSFHSIQLFYFCTNVYAQSRTSKMASGYMRTSFRSLSDSQEMSIRFYFCPAFIKNALIFLYIFLAQIVWNKISDPGTRWLLETTWSDRKSAVQKNNFGFFSWKKLKVNKNRI